MAAVEITAEELRSKLEAGEELLLLDVRDDEDLAGSPGLHGAVHIPMGDVPGRTHELDPDAEIVVTAPVVSGAPPWPNTCTSGTSRTPAASPGD